MKRYALITEYDDKGRVSAIVMDTHEPGTAVPAPGEYAGFDRYVDRYDTFEAALAAQKEALEA